MARFMNTMEQVSMVEFLKARVEQIESGRATMNQLAAEWTRENGKEDDPINGTHVTRIVKEMGIKTPGRRKKSNINISRREGGIIAEQVLCAIIEMGIKPQPEFKALHEELTRH